MWEHWWVIFCFRQLCASLIFSSNGKKTGQNPEKTGIKPVSECGKYAESWGVGGVLTAHRLIQKYPENWRERNLGHSDLTQILNSEEKEGLMTPPNGYGPSSSLSNLKPFKISLWRLTSCSLILDCFKAISNFGLRSIHHVMRKTTFQLRTLIHPTEIPPPPSRDKCSNTPVALCFMSEKRNSRTSTGSPRKF